MMKVPRTDGSPTGVNPPHFWLTLPEKAAGGKERTQETTGHTGWEIHDREMKRELTVFCLLVNLCSVGHLCYIAWKIPFLSLNQFVTSQSASTPSS